MAEDCPATEAVHSDADGRLALVAVQSAEYSDLIGDAQLRQLKGMRSSRR